RIVQGDLGDAGRVGGVGLAATAGVQQARPGGQGGRYVQDLLAGRGQLLGDRSSDPVGALGGERRAGHPAAQAISWFRVPALTSSRRWPSGLPEGSTA